VYVKQAVIAVKRRPGTLYAVLARCLALALVNAFFMSPSRAELLWGANGHPFTAYSGVTLRQQLDYLKDLGLKSYRVNISRLNDAQRLRELVALGKSRNIDILPVLTPMQNWDEEAPAALYREAYDFAFALISMFKNDIRVWELGNEIENYAIIKACEMQDDGRQYNCNWGPAGGVGPLEYFGPRWAKASAVLKGLSDAAVAVDPTIRKAVGTAGWGHLGAFERMQRDGIEWDISVWHMYGQDPEWAFQALAKFNRPIWVTEFNHPEGSKMGEQDQADGLARWIQRLRQLQQKYPVQAAHIYELMDETYWAPGFEAVMGLVHLEKDGAGGWRTGQPKAAYDAVKKLVRGSGELAGATSIQQTETNAAPRSQRLPQLPPRRCELQTSDPQVGAYNNQAAYAYCLILGRPADDGELSDWVDARSAGNSGTQLLTGMMQSEKVWQQYSLAELSNVNFVIRMYQLLLGRMPDGRGLFDYERQIRRGSMNRNQLIRELIASDEFRAKHPIFAELPRNHPAVQRECDLRQYDLRDSSYENQVNYSVCLIVGHQVDGSGRLMWLSARRAGMNVPEMLVAMINSDELTRKYETLAMTNGDFVILIYNLLLGRDPDGQGFSDYTAQLHRGSLSRDSLAMSIIGSDEFRSKHSLLF
jgi:hypothetical protein